jgi:hypothetical protein
MAHFSEVVQTPPSEGQATSVQAAKLVPFGGVKVGLSFLGVD